MNKSAILKAIMETRKADRMTPEKRAAHADKRLRKLVAYAKINSPFYSELYKGIDEDFALGDLPPVTKPEMMSRFDDVLTDRQVCMKRIKAFTSDTDNIGRMIDGRYLVFKTSGSTGNPAVVLYDDSFIAVSSAIAAVRTFARKQDYRNFMKHGKRTAGVFADNGFYLACGMSKYLQLEMPRRKDKINVDVNLPPEQIVSELNAFRPAMLSGYPSNLALLAGLEGLDIHPDVVITGGELLTDGTRKNLSERFGCYVQTHYSCTEAGEIACECGQGHLHINEDWVIVEPVGKDGRPVPSGVQSDRALITNLGNFIQPVIRYELTDRIIVHDEPCPCGRNSRWLEIEGRTDDILRFEGGVRIAPMSFYKILEEVKGATRFQLIQRSASELELRIVSDDREAAFSEAERSLLGFLEENGVSGVKIIRSGQPPQADAVSGKFKHIAVKGRNA